ncbi:hypothetical protein [Actinoalloteichus fjordicus]|uniref:hypothetical protein n=1 Tax=Actinoalloteichus fjordicus TaxID=1612552 RepID=UPI0012F9CD90|nr:hypothetical protein [Actinoalloteichus fjordicus]
MGRLVFQALGDGGVLAGTEVQVRDRRAIASRSVSSGRRRIQGFNKENTTL